MPTLSMGSDHGEAGNLLFSLGTEAGNADPPRQRCDCRFHPAMPSRPGTGKPGTLNRHRAALHPSVPGARTGKQPRCMSLLWFQRNPLPTDRVAQRQILARFDA